jgi:hypothetical protein
MSDGYVRLVLHDKPSYRVNVKLASASRVTACQMKYFNIAARDYPLRLPWPYLDHLRVVLDFPTMGRCTIVEERSTID